MTSETTSHPLLSPEFEKKMDSLTGTVLRDRNTVSLLPSGVESYKKRWELIESAKKNIHIVAFSLMKDETSKRLCDRIRAKLKEGISTRLIFDDGVMWTTMSGSILRLMQEGGAETLRYHKLGWNLFPDRNLSHPIKQFIKNVKTKIRRHFHEKYMVVDGAKAILGGINWGNKYAFGGAEPKAWRDSDVFLSGPVIADIQRRFIRDFFLYRLMDSEHCPCDSSLLHLNETAQKLEQKFIEENREAVFPEIESSGNYRVRYVCHKPYDEQQLPITNAYLLMFRQAKKYIYWGCHGIRPPHIIAETLAEAVRRGVEVRLITNSRKSSRTLMAYGLLGWMYWQSSNHFQYLIEHGIKVFEWQKPGAFHSKNLVIDGVVASVGSYNIAPGSTFYHTESNVIVNHPEFAETVRSQFEIDLQDCIEVTAKTMKKVSSKYDPFRKPLDERNRWIDKSLLTEEIRRKLQL